MHNKISCFVSDFFHIYMRLDEQVVKDVVLTINQAIEPVEKGMTKIQETFHHISEASDDD